MKAKTNEREQVTITASEIIAGLWKLLNTEPAKDGTLFDRNCESRDW